MPAKSSRRTTPPRRKTEPADLLRLQFVSDPQISPDGTQIVFGQRHVGEKNEYVSNLWMVGTDGSEPRQFTGGGRDGHPRWSPDGTRIAFIRSPDGENPQILVIDAAGGEALPLTRFPEGTIKTFKWSPDGRMLAVQFRETDPDWTREAQKRRKETGESVPARVLDSLYYRLDGDGYFNAQRFELYVVDAATGEHRKIYAKDTTGGFHFDWSPDSRQLALTTNTAREPFLKYWQWDLVRVDVAGRKVTKVNGLPEGTKAAVAWSPDGTRIAYAGRQSREHWGVRNTHLFVCDPDGRNLANLTEGSDYCLSASTISDTAEAAFDQTICWSPDGGRIYLNFGWQGETHVVSVPAGGGKLAFHTQGRSTVNLGNLSADGKRFALTVADATHPAEVALGAIKRADRPGELNLKFLSTFNEPLLAELDTIEPEPHWIETSSGTRVHTWVLKPPGFRPTKKYPAILTIHGGPHAQYGESYFHEFQTFAAAGYVVVFSNPRGSKGYGEEHCTAIRGNWGTADWEDVQAVIRFMQEQPYIDASRMGVCGGSYGGYMTNWVIGHTGDFAAAVTDRCVSNLVSMVGSSDLPLVPGEYWDGNSWDRPEPLWEQSPLKFFGNVSTPTLVIHSEGDLRCNVEQGEQVFAALKLRGVPARFVRYPSSTSHGMSRKGPPDLRLHRLGQYLDWWRKYLAESGG